MKNQVNLVKEKLKSQGIEIDDDSLITKIENNRKVFFVKFKDHGIEKEMRVPDFILKYIKP